MTERRVHQGRGLKKKRCFFGGEIRGVSSGSYNSFQLRKSRWFLRTQPALYYEMSFRNNSNYYKTNEKMWVTK